MDIAFSTLRRLAQLLQEGECTSVELTSLFLDRINKSSALHAFVSVDPEAALHSAKLSDSRRNAGRCLGTLDGVPFALKDSFEIAGTPASNGSASRTGRVSTATSPVVRKLTDAGTVLLGRTHMVEFAYGGWGTNPYMGTPRNPWSSGPHMVPGGSSSGSAVAVAAGLAPVAIGTDTGGSVRNPAAFCGVTGLKTTVGLIDTTGVFPLSSTFDSIGPIARDIYDAALACEAMSRSGLRYSPQAAADLRGVNIALFPEQDFPVELDSQVLAAYQNAIEVFRRCGAILYEADLPFSLAELIRYNGTIICAEAWRTHKDAVENEERPIGDAVRARIKMGSSISHEAYMKALSHHRQCASLWATFMSRTDAMLMPSMPVFACQVEDVNEAAGHTAYFNRIANHVGACACTLPGGFSSAGMPIGIQLVGKAFDEAAIIRVGMAFQAQTAWHETHPDLSTLIPA